MIKYGDSNNGDRDQFLVAFKGAPDRLIDRCTKYLLEGNEYKITKNFLDEFKKANGRAFATKGLRVLGLAYKKLDRKIYNDNYPFIKMDPNQTKDPDDDSPEEDCIVDIPIEDLTFVGLIAMEDPPRYKSHNFLEKE